MLTPEEHQLKTLVYDGISKMGGSGWILEETLKKWGNRFKVSLSALPDLCDQGVIIKYSPAGTGKTYYSTPEYHRMETYTASDIIRVLYGYQSPMISDDMINAYIIEAEKKFGKTLHEQQRKAVFMAIQSGFCVITGGPGTGKTCVLQTLTYVLEKTDLYIDIRFTAPTGKAARRIEESVGKHAKTTQMELGMAPSNKNRRYFGGNVLIIDEVSMLDQETTYGVLRAVKTGDKVIFVGDIEQLPSVGPGAVLRDLINAGVVPVTMLTKTFRQAADSNIAGNIAKIKNKEADFNEGEDFMIVDAGEDPLKRLVDLYLDEVSRYGIENVACLLPYRRNGDLCSENFNNVIQAIVNPIGNRPRQTITTDTGREITFTPGDPVMQLENRDEVANGDVGIVDTVKFGKMTVRYPQYNDLKVVYDARTAKQLSLAYAMSIHKSQGSEYKSVVMAITNAHKNMLNKNLVYTGVTRAKERCVLLRDEEALISALSKEAEFDRTTFLAEKLVFYNKKYFSSFKNIVR